MITILQYFVIMITIMLTRDELSRSIAVVSNKFNEFNAIYNCLFCFILCAGLDICLFALVRLKQFCPTLVYSCIVLQCLCFIPVLYYNVYALFLYCITMFMLYSCIVLQCLCFIPVLYYNVYALFLYCITMFMLYSCIVLQCLCFIPVLYYNVYALFLYCITMFMLYSCSFVIDGLRMDIF